LIAKHHGSGVDDVVDDEVVAVDVINYFDAFCFRW
jgi:hypothetical protein